jgi:adsorption protein B
MDLAALVGRAAAELALFAGAGFLLFGINDLVVDLIYFTRRLWRSITVYRRHRPAYASYWVFNREPGFIAILVPAWDEAAVIASMLKSALGRLDYDDYRIFVGHYRNDPAIASVSDPRIHAVQVEADGPTTKADCLNHLYDALIAHEIETERSAKAVVLHDAEDVVHRFELRIFDGLIDRAAVVQLPRRCRPAGDDERAQQPQGACRLAPARRRQRPARLGPGDHPRGRLLTAQMRRRKAAAAAQPSASDKATDVAP